MGNMNKVKTKAFVNAADGADGADSNAAAIPAVEDTSTIESRRTVTRGRRMRGQSLLSGLDNMAATTTRTTLG